MIKKTNFSLFFRVHVCPSKESNPARERVCLTSLSGGEKSKTLFFLIHSLWQHLSCPFRGLDEWVIIFLNNRFLRERGMASTPKMEYQVLLCIFQKNSAVATLGLKEMGKFLWEGREKGLPCWLSQFSFDKTKLRQPTGQTFFPAFPKEFFHFLQT